MSNKRMTGKDYRKAMDNLDKETEALEARIHVRFDELRKKYPEAIIDDAVPAKGIKEVKCKDVSDHWANETMGCVNKIRYIERIEKWSADQQKIEQLYLEIPDEIKKTLKKLSD
jgi:hypothetical protein